MVHLSSLPIHKALSDLLGAIARSSVKSRQEACNHIAHELTDHSRGGKHASHNCTESDQEHDEGPPLLSDSDHQWVQVILEEYPGQTMTTLHVIDGAVLLCY